MFTYFSDDICNIFVGCKDIFRKKWQIIISLGGGASTRPNCPDMYVSLFISNTSCCSINEL